MVVDCGEYINCTKSCSTNNSNTIVWRGLAPIFSISPCVTLFPLSFIIRHERGLHVILVAVVRMIQLATIYPHLFTFSVSVRQRNFVAENTSIKASIHHPIHPPSHPLQRSTKMFELLSFVFVCVLDNSFVDMELRMARHSLFIS